MTFPRVLTGVVIVAILVAIGVFGYAVWWGEFHTLNNDPELRETFIEQDAAETVYQSQHDPYHSQARREAIVKDYFTSVTNACRPEIGNSSWDSVPVLGTPSPECLKHASDVLSRAIDAAKNQTAANP